MSVKTKKNKSERGESLLESFHGWKLSEAKAKFSELVRQAADEPQRVTVEGRDSVVVVSVEFFSKLLPSHSQPNLHELLCDSPLADLDFEFEGERSEVRDVEL